MDFNVYLEYAKPWHRKCQFCVENRGPSSL